MGQGERREEKTFSSVEGRRLDPALMKKLAEEGWTLSGSWHLRPDTYGPGAVNLVFQRTLRGQSE